MACFDTVSISYFQAIVISLQMEGTIHIITTRVSYVVCVKGVSPVGTPHVHHGGQRLANRRRAWCRCIVGRPWW